MWRRVKIYVGFGKETLIFSYEVYNYFVDVRHFLTPRTCPVSGKMKLNQLSLRRRHTNYDSSHHSPDTRLIVERTLKFTPRINLFPTFQLSKSEFELMYQRTSFMMKLKFINVVPHRIFFWNSKYQVTKCSFALFLRTINEEAMCDFYFAYFFKFKTLIDGCLQFSVWWFHT